MICFAILFIIFFNIFCLINIMTTYIDEVHLTDDGGIIKKMIAAGEGDPPT